MYVCVCEINMYIQCDNNNNTCFTDLEYKIFLLSSCGSPLSLGSWFLILPTTVQRYSITGWQRELLESWRKLARWSRHDNDTLYGGDNRGGFCSDVESTHVGHCSSQSWLTLWRDLDHMANDFVCFWILIVEYNTILLLFKDVWCFRNAQQLSLDHILTVRPLPQGKGCIINEVITIICEFKVDLLPRMRGFKKRVLLLLLVALAIMATWNVGKFVVNG